MTAESRTERPAELGQARLRTERAPASSGAPASAGVPAIHPGRHRRAPAERSSYREVFAIREFRAIWTALTAATMLAMTWTNLCVRLIQARRAEAAGVF